MYNKFDISPMLNAYPDSIGGNLNNMVEVLNYDKLKNIFGSFYILPSMFNSDLDRGFSVIDYNLDNHVATFDDLNNIKKLGINLKLDFVLNHISVNSLQFKDLRENGENSIYKDFFIDWNKFWENHGEVIDDGYILPDKKYLDKMFFRKPGLPLLMLSMKDGSKKPYWNTFYQHINYKKISPKSLMDLLDIDYNTALSLSDNINLQIKNCIPIKNIDFKNFDKNKILNLLEENCDYLGQMDLNIKSDLVWDFYDDTLQKLSKYGASIVRLDAFAYASKEIGEPNFLNDTQTFDILEKIKVYADKYNLTILPEIHSSYNENIHKTITQKGYYSYDFFLPGLIIEAIENKNPKYLVNWANEIIDNNMNLINMLGCHDGIPLLDLKGILPEEQIQNLIDIIIARGGFVKNLHGQKNLYYQVNATYYSALGEDDKKMLLARAIQLFMPAKPQIWYLDLFAGSNDLQAVKSAGENGHKEINRTNLSRVDVDNRLNLNIVNQQLDLIKFRNNCKSFNPNASIKVFSNDSTNLTFTWNFKGNSTTLAVDFSNYSFVIVN